MLKVLLSNRKARFLGPYPYEEFNEILKFRKPGWEYTPSARKGYRKWDPFAENEETGEEGAYILEKWDGYIHLLKNNTVGTGVFLALEDKLASTGKKFNVIDERKPPKYHPLKIVSEKKIRPYQKECLYKMIESKSGGLVLNATGTGKTFIAGLYFSCLEGSGLFLVDQLDLLVQAQKEIESLLGEKIGVIGNSIFNPQRITVATIQTIHKHRFDPRYVPWNKKLQAIIIDEIHLALNRRNFQTISVINPAAIFGLTATLELKKKHISFQAYDLAGPPIFDYPLEKGEKEGYLTKGIVVSVEIDIKREIEKYHGNPANWFMRRKFYRERYPIEYQKLIVEGQKRNKVIRDILEEAYRQGKYSILLLERVQHVKEMSGELHEIPHDTVFGEKQVSARVESKKKFEEGDIQLIIANKVFKKGIDIRRVDLIIDAAASKSANDAQQKYGRGVRLCQQKDGLIYIDIGDKGNRFEKATLNRRRALKRLGVPVYKVPSSFGAKKILALAEKALKKRLLS